MKERLDNVDECAFRHDLVGTFHEVYYSWKYPTPSSSSDVLCDVTSENPCSLADRNVGRRWYLGVSANGTVKTFNTRARSSSRDSVDRVFRANERTLFVTRWIVPPSTQSAPTPIDALPALPAEIPAVAAPTANPWTSRRRTTTTKRPTRTSSRCSPLLKDCQRQKGSTSRSKHRKSSSHSSGSSSLTTPSPPARRRSGHGGGTFGGVGQPKMAKTSRTGRHRSSRAALFYFDSQVERGWREDYQKGDVENNENR